MLNIYCTKHCEELQKSEGNFSRGHMYSGCVVHLESDDSALHRYVPNVTGGPTLMGLLPALGM